jgi:1-acyl-sn-glycerol-3-phosphate acyltransferase
LLRRIFRLAAIAAFLPITLPAYLVFRVRGVRDGAPPGVRWLRWMLRCSLSIVGGRLSVIGVPPRSGLIVSNHLSYVDIAALGSSCPCSFVSKAEVGAWPFIGWAAGLAGTVFVRRAHRSEVSGQVEDIKNALGRGVPVVLFPEGTSTDGSQVLPFRSALLQAALETGCDVTPVALRYRADSSGDTVKDICWWGGVGFLPHLWRFLALRSFEATVAFGPSRLSTGDRKSEAVRLRTETLSLLTEISSSRST